MSKLNDIQEPLTLLPIKIEIRKVKTGRNYQPTVARYEYKSVESSHTTSFDTVPLPDNYQESLDKLETRKIGKRLDEYWIRWYPDEINLKLPVGFFNEDEKKAWNEFRAIYDPGRTLTTQDMAKGVIQRAWIKFTEEVGISRAIQMLKHKEESVDGNDGKKWEYDTDMPNMDPVDIVTEKGIQLPTLPQQILLYTINNGQANFLKKVDLKDNILVAPTDLQESHWMSDFEKAVSNGMGIKIVDRLSVRQLKNADWLIAFGVNEFNRSEEGGQESKDWLEKLDSRNVLANLLKRRNALGELSIIKQNTPTNNTEKEKTIYQETEESPEEYFNETRNKTATKEIPQTALEYIEENISDLNLLTKALSLPSDTFDGTFWNDSPEKAQEKAMRTLLFHAFSVYGRFIDETYGLVRNHYNEFKAFFLDNVCASGPLPALRIGENPYGILPVMANERFLSGLDTEQQSFSRKMQLLLLFLKEQFQRLSNNVSTIDRAGQEKYDSLIEILSTTGSPIGLDVRKIIRHNKILGFSNDPEYLHCELSSGPNEEDPLDYLDELSNPASQEYQVHDYDPQETDPLLKRLIDYTIQIYLSEIDDNNDSADIKSEVFTDIQKAASYFTNPETRVSAERLNTLLLQTIDLFAFRLDAWFTGQAFKQLKSYKLLQSPHIGVYGFLEKPGAIEDNSPQPEYIQTPSEAQAISAALLRNASIHNGTTNNQGAFQVNLSSDQVRRGLWHLEGIRAGHLPEELLGYHIERMIHDDTSINDAEIFNLRNKYPLSTQDSPGEDLEDSVSNPTIIHGERFLDEEEDEKYDDIKIEVRKIKDAAADISLAEVVHNTANGNIPKSAAWLDYMDGNNIPPEPDFIRSRRTGMTQSTRIFLPLDTPDNIAPSTTNLRELADPIFADYCSSFMPGFATKSIHFKIALKKDPEMEDLEQKSITINELGICPVDLVVGGQEEIHIRLRYYLLNKWKEGVKALSPLVNKDSTIVAPFPGFGEVDSLMNEEIVKIEWDHENSISTYFDLAKRISSVFHRSQSEDQLLSISPIEFPVTAGNNLDDIDWFKTPEIILERVDLLFSGLENLISEVKESTEFENVKKSLDNVRIILECRRDILNLKESYENSKDDTSNLSIKNTIEADLKNKVLSYQPLLLDSGTELSDAVQNIVDSFDDDSFSVPESLDSLRNRIGSLLENYKATVTTKMKAYLDMLATGSPSLIDKVAGWGEYRALIPWPGEPDLEETKKIMEIWDNIILKLKEKTIGISDRIELAKTHLKVVRITHDKLSDIHSIVITDSEDEEKISRLKTLLSGLSDEEKDEYANLILEMGIQDILDFEKEELFIERIFPGIKSVVSKLNKIIQDLLDKEGIIILTPYALKDTDDGDIMKWNLSFRDLEKEDWGRFLSDYSHVKRDVKDLYELYKGKYRDQSDEHGTKDEILYKKINYQFDPDSRTIEKEDDTDYYYLSAKEVLSCRWFVCLIGDEWSEFYPFGEETTGVALKYESPGAEAPNVILVAVPPKKDEKWTENVLADTIKETIDLMQLRMVSSHQVISDNNLGRLLPQLLFQPFKGIDQQFPSRPKILYSEYATPIYLTKVSNEDKVD